MITANILHEIADAQVALEIARNQFDNADEDFRDHAIMKVNACEAHLSALLKIARGEVDV